MMGAVAIIRSLFLQMLSLGDDKKKRYSFSVVHM